MKLTKSKLKEIILQELNLKTLSAKAQSIYHETIDAEIEEIVRKHLEEAHGLSPLPPTPTKPHWREAPSFEGKIEAAVEQLWDNFHGDNHPNQPVTVAAERVEMWQEILDQLRRKAEEESEI